MKFDVGCHCETPDSKEVFESDAQSAMFGLE